MENRSFEGESPSPPKDPKDNPPGPSKSRADPPVGNEDETREAIPPVVRATENEVDESPPAYVRRYMPKERKIDDLEDLELLPSETVQEPRDVRLDPEFQQQASRRRARRYMQNLVEGPCSLRPDSNNSQLPAPEPYPDQGLAGAPNPVEQVADAPNPVEQVADAPNPVEQVADAPNPVEQVANASTHPTTWEKYVSWYRQINTFAFQFPFHTLLLTWPLATAVMGVLNLKACHIDFYLPYVMLAVGILGTATILLRLYVIYFEHRVTLVRADNFWIGVRCAEFIIWIFFTIQLYYFFKQAPSFNPGEKHYCKRKIYNINCGLMLLSFVTMIGWIIVNVGNFIYWYPRRNERSRNI